MSPDTIIGRVLYRDALVLVLDKPPGLAVHRGPRGRDRETLTDWLDALRFGLPRRPEIAHRLDRDTSGCLALGRHPRALARLAELFRTGQARKTYWAIVDGQPSGEAGTVDLPLARASSDPRDWRMRPDPSGQAALTRWRVLARGDGTAWLELEPVTGRTHQLRVHCAASGWPIRGDRLYGSTDGPLCLHARALALPLYPKKPPVRIEAPPPPAMKEVLDRLGAGASAG